MGLINQTTLAVKSYYKSTYFINEHRLWAWLLLPGLINFLFFIGIGFIAWSYSDDLTNYFIHLFHLETEIGISILFWVTLVLIRLLVLFLFFFVYKYIILILMSPALALFAERIYTIQTGIELPFEWKVFINNVFRGVGIAIKNLFKEVALTLLILLLSFTGVFTPLVPILLFIVQSYYYGFSMMDYKNELEGLNIKQSLQMVWQNKGLTIGTGAVFGLLLWIPFFGAFFAPMIALCSVFISLENKKG